MNRARWHRHVSSRVPAGRRDEPVPLRRGRLQRHLQVFGSDSGALSKADLGAISGPIRPVVPVSGQIAEELLSGLPGEPSAKVAARVARREVVPMREGTETRSWRREPTTPLAEKLREGELSARGLNKGQASRTDSCRPGQEDIVTYEPCLRGAGASRWAIGGDRMTRTPRTRHMHRVGAAARTSAPPLARSDRATVRPLWRGRGSSGSLERRYRERRDLAVGTCDLGHHACSCQGPRAISRAASADCHSQPAVLFCRGDPAVLSGHPRPPSSAREPRPATASGWRPNSARTWRRWASVSCPGWRWASTRAAHEGACGAGAPPIGVMAGGCR